MKITCSVPYAINLTGDGSAPYPHFTWTRRAVLALAVRPGGRACRVVLSRRSDRRFVTDPRAVPPRALSYLLRALPPEGGWTADILPAPALSPVKPQRPDPAALLALAAALSVAARLPLGTPALIETACRAELAAGAIPDLAAYYAAVLGGLREVHPAGPRPDAAIQALAVTAGSSHLDRVRSLRLVPGHADGGVAGHADGGSAVFLGGRPFRAVTSGNGARNGAQGLADSGAIALRPDTAGLLLEVG